MSAPRSLVAVGDSFTEGLDDPRGDGGSFRGWADRVAEHLAARDPEFRYANLAIRGRKLPQIVAEQVPVAAGMGADVVTFAGGTNDILRPRFHLAALESMLRDGVRQLDEAGARVVLFTSGDPSARRKSAWWMVGRIRALNDAVRCVAAEFDCALVDFWASSYVFADPRVWSEDRLHLSSEGHRRVAGAVLEALGVDAGFDWRQPAGPAAAPGWLAARGADVRWARTHLAPWVHRRLTGRSSGDGVEPKRPALARITG